MIIPFGPSIRRFLSLIIDAWTIRIPATWFTQYTLMELDEFTLFTEQVEFSLGEVLAFLKWHIILHPILEMEALCYRSCLSMSIMIGRHALYFVIPTGPPQRKPRAELGMILLHTICDWVDDLGRYNDL